MKALILSAGYGTRLRPLTDKVAKPLVKVMGIPVIEYTLGFLNDNGIKDVFINRHYFPEQFNSMNVPNGMNVRFSTEDKILGTLGGILSFKEYLNGEDFIVINGDIIFNFDLKQAYHAHRARKNLATMILRKKNQNNISSVYLDDFCNVVDIGRREDDVYSEYMFSGIHIIDPGFFDVAKDKEHPSCVVKDFYIPYIKSGNRITGFVPEEKSFFWMELGDLKNYLDSNIKILDLLSRYKLNYQMESFITDHWFNSGTSKIAESVEGVWLGEGYYIDHDATILPPVLIGPGSKIMGGCVIGPEVVIGENVVVSENAQVNRSVILDTAKIPGSNLVENMVVGPHFVFNAQDGQIN